MMASKVKAAIEHYLVTLSTRPGIVFHGYLMSRKDETLEVASKLMEMAEANKLPHLNIVLITTLADSGIACVREILTRHSPEVTECLRTSKNYHISIFVITDNHPDAPALMALH